MGKKLRCTVCSERFKAKKMERCDQCLDVMCKKCWMEETDNREVCVSCNKLNKIKEMKVHVKELMKCIMYLNKQCSEANKN